MIDPHVHCRDWSQSYKETIAHALSIAEKVGISGIFDMPNTNPPIITKDLVIKRLKDATKANSEVFYGIYMGLTSNAEQIKEAVDCYFDLFPKVVGFKMYAGHSVGNLAVTKEEEQLLVYKTLSKLGYEGVLAVHCEKESLMKPQLWSPLNPITHSYVRSEEVELESVRDQINFAKEADFNGNLHICHISSPKSVELVDETRNNIRISCGVTPHHCILSYESIQDSPDAILYKVNPPLRSQESVDKMLQYLFNGKIDLIETDHAPHSLEEKIKNPFMSGFPGLPFIPHFLNLLARKGFSEEKLLRLTHRNVNDIFGINIPMKDQDIAFNLDSEYEVDVYKNLRER